MELIGTIASVIVLISFLMEGETKIRLINIVGSIVFIVYGITINSFSVCFLNGMLILVHLYKVIKKEKK